jgi:excisionase family DNA binding protein
MLGPIEQALRAVVEAAVAPVVDELRALRAEVDKLRAAGPGRDGYLTVAQAAEVAGVKPATIREWIRRGDLAEHRAGRLMRVLASDLDKYLQQGAGRRGPRPAGDSDRTAELIDLATRRGAGQQPKKRT